MAEPMHFHVGGKPGLCEVFVDAPPSIDADKFGPIAAISGFEFFDFRDSQSYFSSYKSP